MTTPDPRIEALFREYPGHPYKKWQGAHWRLVSLVELGVTQADDRIVGAVDSVLNWLLNPRRKTPRVAGRHRQCASKDRKLATRLTAWQWPDGGWNCDPRPPVTHSSFHESLAPLRGLAAFGGFPKVVACAADFFLRHRMYRSESTDNVIDPEWLQLHWPA